MLFSSFMFTPCIMCVMTPTVINVYVSQCTSSTGYNFYDTQMTTNKTASMTTVQNKTFLGKSVSNYVYGLEGYDYRCTIVGTQQKLFHYKI